MPVGCRFIHRTCWQPAFFKYNDMTQDEINQAKVRMAKFMGGNNDIPDRIVFIEPPTLFVRRQKAFHLEDLAYDTDWNWLHELLAKINKAYSWGSDVTAHRIIDSVPSVISPIMVVFIWANNTLEWLEKQEKI